MTYLVGGASLLFVFGAFRVARWWDEHSRQRRRWEYLQRPVRRASRALQRRGAGR